MFLSGKKPIQAIRAVFVKKLEAQQQNSAHAPLQKRWKHNREDQDAEVSKVTISTRTQVGKDGFPVSREAWEERELHAERVWQGLVSGCRGE